ncbi:hypothetical protein GCM10028794_23730 [Silanimonas algicola]
MEKVQQAAGGTGRDEQIDGEEHPFALGGAEGREGKEGHEGDHLHPGQDRQALVALGGMPATPNRRPRVHGLTPLELGSHGARLHVATVVRAPMRRARGNPAMWA